MADAEAVISPQWAMDMGGSRNAKVIYYRNKRGWITWGDTQASKQINMMQKGCQPLPQFGYITDSKDLWGPILRHPDGPAMFPVEQVLTYRWYRDCPVKSAKFPQLTGVKIVEFPCPECQRPGFHSPIHLGMHLRVMHEYDRSEVLKYGDAMGIDFSKVPGGRQIVEYEFEGAVQEVEEAAEELFEVSTISPQSPASPELRAEIEQTKCDECDWVSKPDAKQPEFALSMHIRHAHKAVPA